MSEPLVLLTRARSIAAKLEHSNAVTASSPAQIRSTFDRYKAGALWVSFSQPDLLRAIAQVPSSTTRKHRLLLLGRPDANERKFLQAKFEHVVTLGEGLRLLPKEKLLEVISSPNRADLFIGGVAAFDSVVLVRGDLEPLVIPQKWFRTRPNGPKPEFDALEVIDGGQTVRLGEYEAATDAILYEFDPEFRRRERQRRIDDDRSLGGAIRRLRLQRGLPRSAFLPDVSEKEIARLERGEVKRPHRKTLDVIARRLEVRPEDLASF